jgi:hypothetical protein
VQQCPRLSEAEKATLTAKQSSGGRVSCGDSVTCATLFPGSSEWVWWGNGRPTMFSPTRSATNRNFAVLRSDGKEFKG